MTNLHFIAIAVGLFACSTASASVSKFDGQHVLAPILDSNAWGSQTLHKGTEVAFFPPLGGQPPPNSAFVPIGGNPPVVNSGSTGDPPVVPPDVYTQRRQESLQRTLDMMKEKFKYEPQAEMADIVPPATPAEQKYLEDLQKAHAEAKALLEATRPNLTLARQRLDAFQTTARRIAQLATAGGIQALKSLIAQQTFGIVQPQAGQQPSSPQGRLIAELNQEVGILQQAAEARNIAINAPVESPDLSDARKAAEKALREAWKVLHDAQSKEQQLQLKVNDALNEVVRAKVLVRQIGETPTKPNNASPSLEHALKSHEDAKSKADAASDKAAKALEQIEAELTKAREERSQALQAIKAFLGS